MKVLHEFSGTKHRVVLEVGGKKRAGAWAFITSAARLSLFKHESLVLVTEYSKSEVFPEVNAVYRVERLGEIENERERK
jgi:hypothetical protein